MHTEHVKAANSAYERLLQDYVDYHLALVVVGGFFTLALLGEGLTVADDPAVGLELLRWHFPVQEHVLLFEGNAAGVLL